MFGMMPTPRLIHDFNLINLHLLPQIESRPIRQGEELSSYIERFRKQSEIYDMTSFGTQSVLFQIHQQFSPQFEQNYTKKIRDCRGIVFIDFDETIFKLKSYMDEYNSYHHSHHKHFSSDSFVVFPPFFQSYDVFYNAASKNTWKETLQSLKNKNFLIVLCTTRWPIIGEDEPMQRIINQDLASYIDRQIFSGPLAPKGYIMKYVKDYIEFNQKISFVSENFWLIDDQEGHLDTARKFGFSTISSNLTIQPQLKRTIQFEIDSWDNLSELADAAEFDMDPWDHLLDTAFSGASGFRSNFIQQILDIPEPEGFLKMSYPSLEFTNPTTPPPHSPLPTPSPHRLNTHSFHKSASLSSMPILSPRMPNRKSLTEPFQTYRSKF